MSDDIAALFGPAHAEVPEDDLVAAANAYLDARAAKEQAEATLKVKSLGLDQAEATLLDKMQEAKVTSLKVDGALLSAVTSWHYSLPAGALDDQAVLRWLVRSKGHDLLKMTVHHQSFGGFCRELALAGKPIPDFVKQCERKGIQLRRK